MEPRGGVVPIPCGSMGCGQLGAEGVSSKGSECKPAGRAIHLCLYFMSPV